MWEARDVNGSSKFGVFDSRSVDAMESSAGVVIVNAGQLAKAAVQMTFDLDRACALCNVTRGRVDIV